MIFNNNKKYAGFIFLAVLLVMVFSFLLAGCAEMEPDTIHHLKISVRKLNKKVARLSQNSSAIRQLQLNLANQGVKISGLNSKLNELLGKYEEVSHNLKLLEKEFKDYRLYVNKKLLALSKVQGIPPATPLPAPAIKLKKHAISKVPAKISKKKLAMNRELKMYAAAGSLYKKGFYPKAVDAFDKFLSKYPQSKYTPDAVYFKAVSNYKLKKYPVAILEFHKFTRLYKKNKHVPMAIYLQGLGFLKLSDPSDASILFRQIVSKYSSSDAAKLAKAALQKLSKAK